ncbi:MAG: PEGA domain-containing protein [Myxococcota bacterium]|jgi:hypothetical protein|nr:PEGA domain-containing protein [Myxococcota bacterium]MEC9440383.1 PEGA domain-containing protein [Myxococcota bacterium]
MNRLNTQPKATPNGRDVTDCDRSNERRLRWPITLLLQLCLLGSLSLVMLAPTTAAAQQTQRSTAVLNIEGSGIDAETTSTLTSIMRNEAQQTMYQVVNTTAVNLSDIVVLLGCDASSVACLRQAAEQLEVQVLIYGIVTREGDSYRLRVEIFDNATQKVTHRLQKTVTDQDDIIFTYRRELEKFFGDLREEQLAASLTITSNVRGANVKLNGEDVGITPFERTGLSPGVYAIEVSKEGFTTWNTEIELAERADMRMRAPLQKKRSPVVVDKGDTGDGSGTNNANSGNGSTGTGNNLKSTVEIPDNGTADTNWGGWSLLTVGAFSMAGSGVMALLFRGIERDIDQRNQDGSLDQEEYDSLIQRGESYELSHKILLGVGAAGMVGGTVWLLVGNERQSSELQRSDRAPRARSLELRAAPGGVSGVIRF